MNGPGTAPGMNLAQCYECLLTIASLDLHITQKWNKNRRCPGGMVCLQSRVVITLPDIYVAVLRLGRQYHWEWGRIDSDSGSGLPVSLHLTACFSLFFSLFFLFLKPHNSDLSSEKKLPQTHLFITYSFVVM